MGIALVGYFVAVLILNWLSEFYPKPTASLGAFMSALEAESAIRIVMIWMNTIIAINAFLAFAVAGYLLRTRVLLPGVSFFFMTAISIIKILHNVALPADPSITIFQVVTGNIWGWVSHLCACVIGLLAGQWCYQRRRKLKTDNGAQNSGDAV